MNTEKSDFIEFSVFPLVHRIDDSVAALEYLMDELSEEYCVITFESGYKKKVCISADSEKAIVVDTLKAL